jgi:hypothetical protein
MKPRMKTSNAQLRDGQFDVERRTFLLPLLKMRHLFVYLLLLADAIIFAWPFIWMAADLGEI